MKVYISFIHRSPVKQVPAPMFYLEEPGGSGSCPAEAFVKGIVSPHTMPGWMRYIVGRQAPGGRLRGRLRGCLRDG